MPGPVALVKRRAASYIVRQQPTMAQKDFDMAEGSNRIFDDFGRLMNDAAAMADGVRREAETAFKGQMERFVNDLELVKREDFEALRDLVSVQGEEIEALRREIETLKGNGGTTEPAPNVNEEGDGPQKTDPFPGGSY